MVPRGEIERRVRAFQEALRADGLAGALVVQDVDLYYLAGTAQSAHLIVPVEGEPVLLVRKSFPRAREESPLERVEPLRSLRELPPALASAGLAGGRLGLELDVLPAASYLAYASRLEGFELADCSAALRRLRAVKSTWELAKIRTAAEMLAPVTEWMARHARPGMTEVELAAELERELRLVGHQGVIRFRGFNQELFYGSVLAGPSGAVPGATETPIVGPGPNVAVSKGASLRPIQAGEPILVDLVGAFDGYLADQTRTFSLGRLDRRFVEAYEAAREILHRVADDVRPGVPGAAVYDRALELAGNRDGFMGIGEERVSFVGHGFGLEIDELPLLARGWDEPLAGAMVFALEPKFLFPGEGAVGIENSYLVTGDGAERLTSASEELVEL
ncbi:MAG: Xaa-Pro peptidase family protein [Actinomycetota bacterium]|jgi:Xaa-Pro aminopeptidase|nr:Xaa-Pro peptidase family protein [Actinomycetota bacterium]